MGRPYQSYHSHIAPTFAGESPMFVCSLLEHIVSFELKQPNINSYKNPPTPAFAKAGAAPGTTAGVELFRAGFKCARQASTKPGRQPLLLQGLQPGPLPAHPSRQLPPSSWPSAFQHCSLPFAYTLPSLVRAFEPTFARLQTHKMPQTLLCLHIALSR